MPRLGWTSKARSFEVKITWFHGLALSLGISTLPSVVHAQYNNTGSNGLAPNSFQLPPPPNQQQPAYAPQGQFTAAPQIPPQQYVNNHFSGSQPTNVQNGFQQPGYQQATSARVPGTTVAYNQIGSGAVDSSSLPVPNGHGSGHVYSTPAPTPAPGYSAQPSYDAGSANGSGCAGCASGNCGVHGGTSYSAETYGSGPTYGIGGGSYGYGGNSYVCNDGCGPGFGGGFGGGFGHRHGGPLLGGLGAGGYGGVWSGYGSEIGDACGTVAAPKPWIFNAGGLLMTRVDDSNVRLTSDGFMPSDGLLYTQDAKMKLSGGFQGSVGRYFGGGRYALIATYWGLYPEEQTRYIVAQPGQDLTSDLPWTISNIDTDGNAVGVPRGLTHSAFNGFDWYDMAEAHQLRRSSEFHNFEVNFNWFALGGAARAAESDCGVGGLTGPNAPWYGAQCSKLRFNLFGGVRWFRFEDNLEYATNNGDPLGDYVFNRNDDDFYYTNNVTNDLVGFQIGSLGQLALGSRVNLYAGSSFGIYNNKISADTRAGTDAEVATILSAASASNGVAYNFMRSQNDVAFLGEGNLGIGARIWRGWTANVGYRVVAASGVATAVGQIPYDFSNAEEAARIRNDRSLILHGGVFGMAYNY